MDELLQSTHKGLFCVPGNFFIDPHSPVPRAVVTHAHTDHACWGCQHYLAAQPSKHLLRLRMDEASEFQFLPYGESIAIGGVRVSFHPAGQILGSAQVRLEYRGKIALITGDYKLGSDPTCEAWEPVKCHLMITESTFGLPVYRWQPQETIVESINQWWRESRDAEKCCLLYAYAVGKSQRLLAGLDRDIGSIYCHGAVEKGNDAYRRTGIALPETTYVGSITGKHDWRGSTVIAVPSAHRTTWTKKFGRCSTAMASGWMAIRGARRRRSVDRGFALSDHVDWPSLLTAIEACDPETVWVTSQDVQDTLASQPFPFCLAHPIDNARGPEVLGDVKDYAAEWKWDGIRGQVIRRAEQVFIWSRGEDLMENRWPEIESAGGLLPNGTVLDGEILASHGASEVLPFLPLQKRIGRKSVSKKLLQDVPVIFHAFDILLHAGDDVRARPFKERRKLLEGLLGAIDHPHLVVTELIEGQSWKELTKIRDSSREMNAEGLMLKRVDAGYEIGRVRGVWWKWKVSPYSIDAVLIYAQKGHGKRSGLFTDYTFALWEGDALVPFAKAYSGLDDSEINKIDRFIRQNTRESFGPVRSVTPALVM